MARGPATLLARKSPPRRSAPGAPSVAAPARHWPSSVELASWLQLPHVLARGTQSATSSSTLPTMSKAPSADTQLLREPVSTGARVLNVLQSVVPLSPPGSGVPSTAACHSAFDGNRLRAFLQAACAGTISCPDLRPTGRGGCIRAESRAPRRVACLLPGHARVAAEHPFLEQLQWIAQRHHAEVAAVQRQGSVHRIAEHLL